MGEANALFFREWDARRPGERRSLDRARAVLTQLGLDTYAPQILTVVGSKGKGTTTTYASAYLAAAGQRVVTVTSPALLRDTERIRVDGTEIDEPTLVALGQRLDAARRQLPAPRPGAGYLSPGGLFTLAGLCHAREVGADYLVLEAGRGGASDEVSLVAPAVVAICSIFGEHLDLLGGSLEAVVTDKCAVVRETTRTVVSASQSPAVARLVRDAVVAQTRGRLAVADPDPSVTARIPLPPGLGRANAVLGATAAWRLLGARPHPEALDRVLRTVTLPGRLSLHRLPGSDTQVLVDAAVSRTGYAAATAYADRQLGGFDHVLLSVPDDKDLAGAVRELGDAPVTFVTVSASHLRYSVPLPPTWPVVPASRVDVAFVAALGRRVLALGTVSFVAHLLRLLDAPSATIFRPNSPPT